MTSYIPKKYAEARKGVLAAVNSGSCEFANGGVVNPDVKVRVFKTRKGWQWEERNYYGGTVGAVSPKTYDTKSNAVRAARRRVELLKAAVVVIDA
ncbi:hypothetical protein [Gordonia tangerina]|uniref:DUF1508 domain-containing protein n=1 Tax=Gordonia tangerina TaxID=2911060 RepID=A0ABS9DLH4_9ACTN|nr:hypothetical protein [Gordonia tangerina]MCF3939943.1 hypothetical protein [Gordonia tangerina]